MHPRGNKYTLKQSFIKYLIATLTLPTSQRYLALPPTCGSFTVFILAGLKSSGSLSVFLQSLLLYHLLLLSSQQLSRFPLPIHTSTRETFTSRKDSLIRSVASLARQGARSGQWEELWVVDKVLDQLHHSLVKRAQQAALTSPTTIRWPQNASGG